MYLDSFFFYTAVHQRVHHRVQLLGLEIQRLIQGFWLHMPAYWRWCYPFVWDVMCGCDVSEVIQQNCGLDITASFYNFLLICILMTSTHRTSFIVLRITFWVALEFRHLKCVNMFKKPIKSMTLVKYITICTLIGKLHLSYMGICT